MSTTLKRNIVNKASIGGKYTNDTAVGSTCSVYSTSQKKKNPKVSTRLRLSAMKNNSKHIKDQLKFFVSHRYYTITPIDTNLENISITSIHKHLKNCLPAINDHRLQAEARKGIGNKKLRRLLSILIQRYVELYSYSVNQKEELDQQLIATHLLRDNIYHFIHEKWAGESGFIIASCIREFLISVDIKLFNHRHQRETPLSSIEIEDKVLKLIKRRLTVPSVRASYNIWVSRYLMASSDIKVSKEEKVVFEKILPFLAEVMVSIMYYDNQVLDGKYEVDNTEDIYGNILSANILKEVAYSYLTENIFAFEAKKKVLAATRKIFSSVNIGQFIDKKLNIYSEDNDSVKNIKFSDLRSIKLKSIVDLIYGASSEAKIAYPICEELDRILQNKEIRNLFRIGNVGLDSPLSLQLNIYVNRISLTSALFFTEFLALIGDLLCVSKESVDQMEKHAINYGLSLQIVNDNADFVHRDKQTVGKVEADVLKDIQNKTMTLPIILHLQKKNRSSFVRHLLKSGRKKYFKPFIVRRVFKEMVNSGALSKAIEISQNIARAASIQDLNKDCLEGLYINDLQSIAFKNWYFTEINELIEQQATTQEEALPMLTKVGLTIVQQQDSTAPTASKLFVEGYKWLQYQFSQMPRKIDEYIHGIVDIKMKSILEKVLHLFAFSYHSGH